MKDAQKRRLRVGTVVLIASLALNGLLAGFIAVKTYRLREHVVEGPVPPRLLVMMKRRLPPSDQAIMDEILKARQPQFVAAQAEFEKSLGAAVEQLTRPSFDETAFRAAVMDARDKRLRSGDLGIEAFLDTVDKISPEGRRDLAGRIRLR